MKVGDKLYCIKGSEYKKFGITLPEMSGTTHIKDNFYQLIGFRTKSGNFVNKKDTIIFEKNTESIFVEAESGTVSFWGFTIEPSNYMFSEHFITLQNNRKQKLKKINRESRNNE